MSKLSLHLFINAFIIAPQGITVYEIMKKKRLTVNLEEEDFQNLEEEASERRLSNSALARSLIVEGLKDEG